MLERPRRPGHLGGKWCSLLSCVAWGVVGEDVNKARACREMAGECTFLAMSLMFAISHVSGLSDQI